LALHPLIEYRSILEGNRQIFWLNHADAFHAFAEIDQNFMRIVTAIQVGRDANNRTRAHVIPLLLLMQRQARSAFDLLSTYRGYEAWVLIRPAIELALMLGKFEEDPETFKVWQNRRDDPKRYRKIFTGKKLRSKSLPRSEDIQQVLRRINDDFMHANTDYFSRHFEIERVDSDNLGLKVVYTDDDEELSVQLWAFLHLLIVIQDSISKLLNHAFVNAQVKIAPLVDFEKRYQVKCNGVEQRDRFLMKIGLWHFVEG